MSVLVEFEPPYDIYNYAYMTHVPLDVDKVNIMMPQADYDATAYIGASSPGYFSAEKDIVSLDNKEYWELVGKSDDVFAKIDLKMQKLNVGECMFDYDCPEMMACFEGVCEDVVIMCESYIDCPEEYLCIEGECVQALECIDDIDCGDFEYCTDEGRCMPYFGECAYDEDCC